MALHIDPERNEVRALRRAADWRDRRVLEIGCGAGRLTARLLSLGARVTALDPDAAQVRAARRRFAGRPASKVRVRVGKAQRLGDPDDSYDRVVFAWAL
jgi:protein-L-isoaspartate O-methyltransferase